MSRLNVDPLGPLFPLEPAAAPAGGLIADRGAGSFDEALQQAHSAAARPTDPDQAPADPPRSAEGSSVAGSARGRDETRTPPNGTDSPSPDRPTDKPDPAADHDNTGADAHEESGPPATSGTADDADTEADKQETQEPTEAVVHAAPESSVGPADELILKADHALPNGGAHDSGDANNRPLPSITAQQQPDSLPSDARQAEPHLGAEGEQQTASATESAGALPGNLSGATPKQVAAKPAHGIAEKRSRHASASETEEPAKTAGESPDAAGATLAEGAAAPSPEPAANARRSGPRSAGKAGDAARQVDGVASRQTQSAQPDQPRPDAGDAPQNLAPELLAPSQRLASEAVDATLKTVSLDGASPETAPASARSAGAEPATASHERQQASPASEQIDRVRFVQRVARAFESAGEHGGSIRLRLHPPELGSLRLALTVQNGVMRARMEAETPTARNLLLDNLPALRERLAEQQIKVEKFDVDLADHSAGGSWQQPADQPRPEPDQAGRSPAARRRQEAAVDSVPSSGGASRYGKGSSFDVII